MEPSNAPMDMVTEGEEENGGGDDPPYDGDGGVDEILDMALTGQSDNH